MGKPFASEIARLSDTYKWALAQPISEVTSFIEDAIDTSLIAVGSGGSSTVANLGVLLHEQIGMLSKAVTPLEVLYSDIDFSNVCVLIPSASGRNPDIVNAFEHIAMCEPKQMLAICMRTRSKLKEISDKYSNTQIVEYESPAGKDGFLATNSQIAFSTILCRAYENVLNTESTLLDELSIDAIKVNQLERLPQLVSKETLIVLYDKWSLPASLDLESKYSEAGLGNVQLTDYRNFGHGRHYWLETQGDKTGIVAFITPESKRLAEKTFELIPEKIPIFQISTEKRTHIGGMELLVEVLHFVNQVSLCKGVDPGNPKVPMYGRKLYHLGIPFGDPHKNSRNTQRQQIKRKFGILSTVNSDLYNLWINSLKTYIKRIEDEEYGSVIFDYDGTLCSNRERFIGISTEIAQGLIRLLENKVIVGIATGRGRSVGVDLREKIPPRLWDNIVIGYYNCSDIALLSDSNSPNKGLPLDDRLDQFLNILKNKTQLNYITNVTCRPKQITLEPTHPRYRKLLRRLLFDLKARHMLNDIQVLESSHSFDILACDNPKQNLIEICRSKSLDINTCDKVLCIGDKGGWPGNDFYLLSGPYSLGVDALSSDPDNCWNLCKPGYTGPRATLEYLEKFKLSNGKFRYTYTQFGRK
ncbi:hypothetical protein F8E02_02300 [Methanoculleus sp. Wushi-C6]|uniref:SIS domain-containing protein n=1 Tax=Methanoculleus caldifontis TaxID=2651577 RepID=A0ABU3WYH5_9EURY|nr:hypothetical protein [Methanoculleus sp. Wushi-C6]MDV2480854.1 hypothetical protein [Methanoculleus sp. Wushi-C6]